MTARVYLESDFLSQGLRVAMVYDRPADQYGPATRTLRRPDGTMQPLIEAVTPEPGDTLFIPEDFARALLEELTRWYHGAEDTRALRRDYDAERKRVDLLIGTLSMNMPRELR